MPTSRLVRLIGQYGVLVVLAVVVLAPIYFTLLTALSPPERYEQAGRPLHPVSVDWIDRTWFSGGAVSIVLRTLVLIALLAVLHLRPGMDAAAPMPRRLLAVGLGAVAVVGLLGPVLGQFVERSSLTALWVVLAIAIVAATQLVGFEGRWPLWESAIFSVLAGAGLFGGFVVATGAQVWTQAWEDGDLEPAMARSFVVAVLITVCQVVTSILAAYAFAFLRFPLKTLMFGFFMATMLLPLEVTLLANQQTIRELGWVDTNHALVLPFAATAFGTFLIRQGFKGLPPELRDATRLDGYGHWAFLWRFAVPLTRPVIASFTVISAMGAWNQYLWPRAVIDSEAGQTAQIKLRTITGENFVDANMSVAAALLVAVPVVVLLIGFQRQIIRGLTAGAVKG